MKTILLLALTLTSLSSFAASVGEDLKGECTYSNQSNKREAKVVNTTPAPTQAPKATGTISK